MSGVKVVSSNTQVEVEQKQAEDGAVKTTKSVTVDKFNDGSITTTTKVQTQSTYERDVQRIKDNLTAALSTNENAAKAPLTTDQRFIREALDAHNEFRLKHDGVEPLTLSTWLCEIAQASANDQAEKEALASSAYGENTFWISANIDDGKFFVQHWYNEIKEFDWGKMQPQMGTSHFAQLIWKDSRELGIAKAVAKNGSIYVVARYEPPGNIYTTFEKNIARPLSAVQIQEREQEQRKKAQG